jgi:chemotaxis methyl-accepting protein methylase
MCRNFLPYLQIGEQKNLVKQLSKKLDSTSMVVLGKFEIDYGIEKLFEKEGFVHTSQYNVMKKLPFFKALLTKLKYGLKLR